MKTKLSKKEFLGICLLLFGLFFGAGNLIFPPMLGYQAGPNTWSAMLGFLFTAVIIPFLGIVALVKTDGIDNLGNRVGKIFAIVYPSILMISIGPGIAIPRNSSLAFEMSIAPYFRNNNYLVYFRLAYTLIFFIIAVSVCLRKSKVTDIMSKFLTPMLLILIFSLFLAILLNEKSTHNTPNEIYNNPIFKGFLEGYNTMDILASLNFGYIIYLAIEKQNVKEKKNILSIAKKGSFVAGSLLLLIYVILAYIGKNTVSLNNEAQNGGQILFNVTNNVFGTYGSVILIMIFTLACLTNVIGLITTISEYYERLTKNKIKYNVWVFVFAIVSFILANFGLNKILVFSVPILVAIYPAAIILIFLALTNDIYNWDLNTYKNTVYLSLIISIVQSIQSSNISIPIIGDIFRKLPFYEYKLEWVLPVILILFITEIYKKFNKS